MMEGEQEHREQQWDIACASSCPAQALPTSTTAACWGSGTARLPSSCRTPTPCPPSWTARSTARGGSPCPSGCAASGGACGWQGGMWALSRDVGAEQGRRRGSLRLNLPPQPCKPMGLPLPAQVQLCLGWTQPRVLLLFHWLSSHCSCPQLGSLILQIILLQDFASRAHKQVVFPLQIPFAHSLNFGWQCHFLKEASLLGAAIWPTTQPFLV